MKTLLLVDGNNVLMRIAKTGAFNRLSYKGEPTGVIHGTVTQIWDAIDKYSPHEVAVIFDGVGAKEVKRRIYAGYKANRESHPEEIVSQLEYTKNVLRASGLFVFHQVQKDADDIIATLCTLKRKIIIMSNDKDFSYLLQSPRIRQLKDGNLLDAKYVVNRFGVHPKRFAEYLALVGDSVDGIPGLAKCGPVSAVKIMEECPTWKDVLDSPPAKWQDRIRAAKKELVAFHRLTSLDTHALDKATLQRIIPSIAIGDKSPDLPELLRLRNLQALERRFKSNGGGILTML